MSWEIVRRSLSVHGMFKVGRGGFTILTGAGAPTDGTSGSGAGEAGPGSFYVDTDNAAWYINGGTKATPAWEPAGSGGSLGALLEVRNETGGTLRAGTPVYISGYNATQDKWLVTKADADAAGRRAEYVITASLTTATNGLAAKTYRGAVNGTTDADLDLNGAAVGDPVYLSTTAGQMTLAAPSGNDDIVQIIGRVAVVASDIVEVIIQQPIVIGTNELASSSVTTAKIAAAAVDNTKLSGGFNKINIVAGQDETGDDTITLTGIAVGDELVAVFVEDGTSGKWTRHVNADFTITANTLTIGANKANNSLNSYIIFWNDLT